MQVRVVPHDPTWSNQFRVEANQIRASLAGAAVTIHHIGSTSIPTTWAKPVIDILVEVVSLEALDKRSAALVALGYDALGEFGITSRRYFRKDDDRGVRRYQVHAFVEGSVGAIRPLAFRDYLRAHPLVAQQYSDLKRALAERHHDDGEAYIMGKTPFIQSTESKALLWWHAQAW